MEQMLKVEFTANTMDKLSALPTYDNLVSTLNKIHLATDEMMSEIPLCALYLLALIAQERQMNEALAIVEKEISLNLEAQQEADEAERRAEKAEQELQMNKKLADEAEVWAQGLKNLRKSMELRYKQTSKN